MATDSYQNFLAALGFATGFERQALLALDGKAGSTVAKLEDLKKHLQQILADCVFDKISPVKKGVLWGDTEKSIAPVPEKDPFQLWTCFGVMYYTYVYKSGAVSFFVSSASGESNSSPQPGDTSYLVDLISAIKLMKAGFFYQTILSSMASAVDIKDPLVNDFVTGCLNRLAVILLDNRDTLDAALTLSSDTGKIGATMVGAKWLEKTPFDEKVYQQVGAAYESVEAWEKVKLAGDKRSPYSGTKFPGREWHYTGFPAIIGQLAGYTPCFYFTMGMHHVVVTLHRLVDELNNAIATLDAMIKHPTMAKSTYVTNDIMTQLQSHVGFDKYMFSSEKVGIFASEIFAVPEWTSQLTERCVYYSNLHSVPINLGLSLRHLFDNTFEYASEEGFTETPSYEYGESGTEGFISKQAMEKINKDRLAADAAREKYFAAKAKVDAAKALVDAAKANAAAIVAAKREADIALSLTTRRSDPWTYVKDDNITALIKHSNISKDGVLGSQHRVQVRFRGHGRYDSIVKMMSEGSVFNAITNMIMQVPLEELDAKEREALSTAAANAELTTTIRNAFALRRGMVTESSGVKIYAPGIVHERRFAIWNSSYFTRYEQLVAGLNKKAKRGSDEDEKILPEIKDLCSQLANAIDLANKDVGNLVKNVMVDKTLQINEYGHLLYQVVNAVIKTRGIAVPVRYKYVSDVKDETGASEPLIFGSKYICALGQLDIYATYLLLTAIFNTLVGARVIVKRNGGQSDTVVAGPSLETADITLLAVVEDGATPVTFAPKGVREVTDQDNLTFQSNFATILGRLTNEVEMTAASTFKKPSQVDPNSSKWLLDFYNSFWEPKNSEAPYVPRTGMSLPKRSAIPELMKIGDNGVKLADAIEANLVNCRKMLRQVTFIPPPPEDRAMGVQAISAIPYSETENSMKLANGVTYTVGIINMLFNGALSMLHKLVSANYGLAGPNLIDWTLIRNTNTQMLNWRNTFDTMFYNTHPKLNDVSMTIHAIHVAFILIGKALSSPNNGYMVMERFVSKTTAFFIDRAYDSSQTGCLLGNVVPLTAIFGFIDSIQMNMAVISTLINHPVKLWAILKNQDTITYSLAPSPEVLKNTVADKDLVYDLKYSLLRLLYCSRGAYLGTVARISLPGKPVLSTASTFQRLSEAAKALVYLQTVQKTLNSDVLNSIRMVEGKDDDSYKFNMSEVVTYFYTQVLEGVLYRQIELPLTTMFVAFANSSTPENYWSETEGINANLLVNLDAAANFLKAKMKGK